MRKKGTKNKKYSPDFKLSVIMDMRENHLGLMETERKYNVVHSVILQWERIFLEEGAEGLMKERRGRASAASGTRKGRPPKFDKKVEEDLIAENQRLRMENEYLKKLNALVQERIQRENKKK
jgi:transposase